MRVCLLLLRWSEALHGVAASPGVHFGGKVGKPMQRILLQYNVHIFQVPNATSFPQVINLGATFNK